MSLDEIYSFITKEGNSYKIIFNPLDKNILPDGINIDINIVEVVISVDNHLSINSISTLTEIVEIIKDYLEKHDVVLYSYCDNKEILIRNNREFPFSPQAYRSQLFSTLFAKYDNLNYLNEVVIINDDDNGNHYIHLISHLKNTLIIKHITDYLRLFGKDEYE